MVRVRKVSSSGAAAYADNTSWEDEHMKYTLDLNDWEANALKVMMKEEFKKNMEFIEQNERVCRVAPELKAFTEYAQKEQMLYNKVYIALRKKRE